MGMPRRMLVVLRVFLLFVFLMALRRGSGARWCAFLGRGYFLRPLLRQPPRALQPPPVAVHRLVEGVPVLLGHRVQTQLLPGLFEFPSVERVQRLHHVHRRLLTPPEPPARARQRRSEAATEYVGRPRRILRRAILRRRRP